MLGQSEVKRYTAMVMATIRAGMVATIGVVLGCAGTEYQDEHMPASRWNDNYFYNYEPPQKMPAASVQANVIVVNPFYREAESAFVDVAYAKVGKGFSKSMGVDLDKIIVAKGMTAIGPYATLDDVTYPDKKGADLTLAPRVFLTSDTKMSEPYTHAYNGVWHMEKSFTMKLGGWVAYEMREPLSGQKMWVKKLELEELEVKGVEIYEAKAVRADQYGHVLEWGEGKLVYSGRAERLADALRAYYPTIMEKAWTYLNTEEILDLKEKTKEIRERKVF